MKPIIRISVLCAYYRVNICLYGSKLSALAFRQAQKTGYIKTDTSNDQCTNKKPH